MRSTSNDKYIRALRIQSLQNTLTQLNKANTNGKCLHFPIFGYDLKLCNIFFLFFFDLLLNSF